MQADYSVELGPDDPALEWPWSAEDGSTRYFNIKQHPDLVLNIREAREHPELSEFLSRINAPAFPLETAKCDTWFSQELFPEEEVFGASCKFVSYVDLFFSAADLRLSLEKHESFVQKICKLLERAPEMSAGAEFVVRRCYYHHEDGRPDDSTSGYSITAYVSGYGDTEEEALQRWVIALKLLQNALVQISLQ
ncbi:MAG: hypothetical protein DMG65_21275 [Candidatus Angelobacter sp. Gp1-AA117]|nr:MAG: hypothetical protein DMG65_21275 [Candidatus Angelobacter sp. Gp1-AA117]